VNARGHYGRAVVGARHPLEVAIDRETDRRFFDEIGGDSTRRLDPSNEFDRMLMHRWLSIRYQVAQEVAARAAPPPHGQVTVTREQQDNPLARSDFDAAQVVSSGDLSPRARAVYLGNFLYHSVGDIEDAVKQLAADYDAAYADIGRQIGVLPYVGSGERVKQHPAWYVWWTVVASPLFDRFTAFKHEMLGGDLTFGDAYVAYTNRMKVTSWTNEIVSWHDKLVSLRSAAERMGLSFMTPPPTKPATTLPEDARDFGKKAAEKAGEGIGDVWKLLKYGLWGALGIGAVVALSSVASNLRSGQDPAQKYVDLVQRRRTPRAALSGPDRLELPAGEGALG